MADVVHTILATGQIGGGDGGGLLRWGDDQVD